MKQKEKKKIKTIFGEKTTFGFIMIFVYLFGFGAIVTGMLFAIAHFFPSIAPYVLLSPFIILILLIPGTNIR